MTNINRLITLWMGEEYTGQDFSQPDHFARMTKRLFENKEMWDKYYQYAFKRYLNSETHNTLVPWLFSDRTLFTSLFAEFLRLPETVEEFGREECPNCEQGYAIRKVGHRMEGTTDRCQFCDGTGKVLSDWAREEEGK